MSTLRLIAIPSSHFVEKARWALERAGLAYREERHPPLFHRLALLRVSGGTTVPVLVIPQRGTLRESAAILHYVDPQLPSERRLYPQEPELRAQVEEFEQELGHRFARAVVRWVYHHVMPARDSFVRLCTEGSPERERSLFAWGWRFTRFVIRTALRINQATADEAAGRLDEGFAKVSDMLSDGRRYLFGSRFSAADLTFASLAAHVVWEPGFRGVTPRPDELPVAAQQRRETWGSTPAGQFVHRIYAEER